MFESLSFGKVCSFYCLTSHTLFDNHSHVLELNRLLIVTYLTRSVLKCDLLNTRLFLIKKKYIYCHLLFCKIYIYHVLNINRLIIIHLFGPLCTYALKYSLLNTRFSFIKKKKIPFSFS